MMDPNNLLTSIGELNLLNKPVGASSAHVVERIHEPSYSYKL